MASSSKSMKVALATFKKWNFKDIQYEKEVIDGTVFVTKVYCMTCRRREQQIRRDRSINGVALNNLKTYVKGTTFVTKHNVMRHINTKVSEALF